MRRGLVDEGGSVRAIVPLYDTEIRGVPILKKLGDAMFAEPVEAALPGARS